MLHFVWKLWDKSATGVIKVEAIQLVWGPVIYPLFPCQLSSSSLSVVIFIDRRREPRQKKSLQRRACGPGLFYLCLNPIQVRYFHLHEFYRTKLHHCVSLSFTDWCSNYIHLLLRFGLCESCCMLISTHNLLLSMFVEVISWAGQQLSRSFFTVWQKFTIVWSSLDF